MARSSSRLGLAVLGVYLIVHGLVLAVNLSFTGLPLLQLSGSVGHIVAVLALLPPWILLYLVSGKAGFRDGWPLALVGSLGYIAGQYPVAPRNGKDRPAVFG